MQVSENFVGKEINDDSNNNTEPSTGRVRKASPFAVEITVDKKIDGSLSYYLLRDFNAVIILITA